MKFPKVKTFHIEKDPKKQAIKVLEECSELVEAVKFLEDCLEMEVEDLSYARTRMREEACDVLVALANLLDLYAVDKEELKETMSAVEYSNMMRGRYACE